MGGGVTYYCLLQCFNALPPRRILLDGLKDGCVSNVTAALTNVMNDMDCNKNSSVYPGELHRAMQNRYNIVANEQRDIHESFTTICSDGKKTGMNDVVASHFNIGSQFRKTCTEWVIRRWNARNANVSIYTCIEWDK